MSIGEYCNREVIVIESHESVNAAVQLMREHHVGDVIVVAREAGQAIPAGIVTDRDIVLEILAEDVEPESLRIGDVVSGPLVSVSEDTGLLDTIKLMREKGVRRMPVIDDKGALVGIVSADDVLELIAEQLTDLVGLIRHEQRREQHVRR